MDIKKQQAGPGHNINSSKQVQATTQTNKQCNIVVILR